MLSSCRVEQYKKNLFKHDMLKPTTSHSLYFELNVEDGAHPLPCQSRPNKDLFHMNVSALIVGFDLVKHRFAQLVGAIQPRLAVRRSVKQVKSKFVSYISEGIP